MSQRDIKKLIEDLKSNDLIIRENAISTLGDAAADGVNISSAISALITALSDKSSIIRGNAAEALASAASSGNDISSAIPALERAASDSVPYVSESANKALQAASKEYANTSNENSRFRVNYQGKNSKGGAIVFALVGLVFFGVGVAFMYNDYIALSWLKMNGEVTYSDMGREYDSDSGTMFSADIEYQYEYNDKTYKGHCCGYSTSDFTSIQRLVDSNAVGEIAGILVNPGDPYQSRLKEDVNPFNLFYLIFAGMGALFALIGIYLVFKERKMASV